MAYNDRMKTKLTFLLALTFLFLFSGSVFADDLQDADDAYQSKDYETAYKLLLPLAKQGYAPAQHKLGLMYLRGQEVLQDYKEAIKWYLLAAEQEYSLAQNTVGAMYAQGKGVPQDYVLAHMWFNLASSKGNKNYAHNRNLMEGKMTPSQIAKAQEMARNWKPKK
jgi:TPR repeat protein